MRKSYFLYLLIFIIACNGTSNKGDSNSDSTINVDTFAKSDTAFNRNALIELNEKILRSLKSKDYSVFTNYIHPTLGLHFSPYATINFNNDVVIKPAELLKMIKDDTKLFWGSYDGTGDPIDLSVKEYFAQFVYDADFIHAEKISINRSSAKGNSINNISSVYPECDYVENYFSGFNKEYEGLDWRALRLVFKKEGERYYLVGIVHDQWTI